MSGIAVVAEETVPSESNPDVSYKVRLMSDGTSDCECAGWRNTGRCKHVRACFVKWTTDGVLDSDGNPVGGTPKEAEKPAEPTPPPPAAPSAAAPPAAPAKPVWRAGTEKENEAWKFHSSKAGAKNPLPDYVRKINTGERDDKGMPIMRVEILVGSPADVQPRTEAAAPAQPGGAVPAKRPNGAAVPVVAAKAMTPKQRLDEMREIKDNDFYEVSRYNERTRTYEKVKVPSAKVWNAWSLGDGGGDAISTEYVRDRNGIERVGMDETKAWAVVRGRRGNVVREASVTIIFAVEQAKLVVDKIKKRFDEIEAAEARGETPPNPPIKYAMDERTGLPMLLDPKDQIEVISQVYRTRMFGDRMATTKAESIVERKLLGVEFQEEDELRHERDEVRAVEEANNAGAPPPVTPQPSTKAAAGVASRFPETAA